MLVSQILRTKGSTVFTCRPQETVVRVVAEKGEAGLSQPVRSCMTCELIFAEPQVSVNDLLGRMTDRRIRHLPVCIDGRLTGIISIGDLVKSKISEIEAEADGLKAYIAAG